MMSEKLANLMFSIPLEAFELIFVNYLALNEWGKMDVALCTTHPLRGFYLQALRSELIQLKVEYNELWCHRLKRGILEWIISR